MDARYQRYQDQLDQLHQQHRHRLFRSTQRDGDMIQSEGLRMLNLSSNDYLGLGIDPEFRQQFWDQEAGQSHALTSSSSRLLTGHFAAHEQLEAALTLAFGRPALLFNSGYHLNIGILPAVSTPRSVIISDELIHASIIDGIRLSKAQRQRYRHQDLGQLAELVQQAQQDEAIDQIIIVTESLFSMDGDITDLTALVQLRQTHNKVLLYVDDAHAVGVYGTRGLGLAEQQGVLNQIDLLVGTFGKALASQGGYVICAAVLRDYLINTVRPLIFSTALPPLNLAWTRFVFEQMQGMSARREHLADLSHQLIDAIHQRGLRCPSHSHIVPVIYGDNALAVQQAHRMQQHGYYVMPIRPPTVTPGTARVRLCLHAGLQMHQLEQLVECLSI